MTAQDTRSRLIAEIGSVHDGSFGNACKLIELAAHVGADTVKFQTHVAEAETLPDAPSPSYFKGEDRISYFRRTAFTPDQWHALRRHAHEHGLRFMSSPFALEAVDILEAAAIDSYKVASGEVTNLPLLERLAVLGRPVYLSSGMSNWAELDAAVSVLREAPDLVILQCTSLYPCPPERVGLNVMQEMRSRFGLPVGFSDHTRGPAAAMAAVALGADCVEKHLTFSRSMYGSDAANATEPGEFAALALHLGEIRTMLSHPLDKDDVAPVQEMKRIFEKSVVSSRPLAAGSVLRMDDLSFKKPGDGLSAAAYRSLLGRRLAREVPADHRICEGDLE
jgi:N,N'-diacetyllegionaminate synthase